MADEIDPLGELTTAVRLLTKELQTLRKRSTRQAIGLIAAVVGVLLDITLTVVIVVLYNDQASARDAQGQIRREALCPLFSVALSSFTPQLRSTLPPDRQIQFDDALVKITHGAEVLGCKK
jgi:hypothetical protein